jgi:hypothetical protein
MSSKQYMHDWYLENSSHHKKKAKKRAKEYRVFLSHFLTGYKSFIGCSHCGVCDFRVLDFHHLENKEIGISKAVRHGWSFVRLFNEISKCSLLCSNCHRVETYESIIRVQ